MNIILSESKHHEKPPFQGDNNDDSFSFDIPVGEAFEGARVSIASGSRYNAGIRVIDSPMQL